MKLLLTTLSILLLFFVAMVIYTLIFGCYKVGINGTEFVFGLGLWSNGVC